MLSYGLGPGWSRRFCLSAGGQFCVTAGLIPGRIFQGTGGRDPPCSFLEAPSTWQTFASSGKKRGHNLAPSGMVLRIGSRGHLMDTRRGADKVRLAYQE